MLKAEEVTPASPLAENLIVTPVNPASLVAVRPVKVAVPLTALTEVPPPSSVQVPAPTEAVTVAMLVVALPY